MSRRAFVISPIGPPDSEIREHADDVFKFIIKPAMDECGIEAIRSDHLTEPGTISSQMFREIFHDDLCIAVLTGRNPNVYYELAVAQAAGRPVIILIQQGEMLPFDVSDLRAVEYTMKPTPLVEGTYAQQVVAHVRALEANGWKATAPFGELLGRDERLAFYARSRDWGTSDAWGELLAEAESVFEVMGLGLRGWRAQHTRRALVEKANSGCDVRILVVDPDNPALRQSINDAIEDESFELLCRDIHESLRVFGELADQAEKLEVRSVRIGMPHMQVARNDRHAVVIPYLFSEQPGASPLLRCSADHELYRAAAQEVSSLWAANGPTL